MKKHKHWQLLSFFLFAFVFYVPHYSLCSTVSIQWNRKILLLVNIITLRNWKVVFYTRCSYDVPAFTRSYGILKRRLSLSKGLKTGDPWYAHVYLKASSATVNNEKLRRERERELGGIFTEFIFNVSTTPTIQFKA